MSAVFNVAEGVAFTGWAAGACAAKAEENRMFSRTAATPNKRQDTAAIVRTDERCKIPPGTYLGWMLSRTHRPFLVTHGHLPLVRAGAWRLTGARLNHRGLGLLRRFRWGLRQNGAGEDWGRHWAVLFPPCANYFSSFPLTFH